MSEYTRKEILELIQENGGPEGLDLSGKDLSGIDLSGGVTLQGANLQGANLRHANLQGANLRHAELQGAILWGADLQGASLWNTCFRGADLRSADFQGSTLAHTHLQGAHLCYSNFEKADLFGPGRNLEGAYFYSVFLDDTRMRREQLGEEIGEEKAKRYGKAREAYLALKNNFAEIGRHNDAAWAYRKERRMEKLAAFQKAKQAWQEHDWKGALRRYAKVAGDQLVEWACDYGESVPRVLCSLLAIYVLFTLIYGLTWSVIRVHATPTAIIREPTRNLVDLARFSLGAMTTMDLTGLEPRNGLVELLAGVEALLGIALTGLLGFVAGNRIRRS